MNHLNVFLNTKVESSGALAWIGDTGLASFRYIFNGKTVRIHTSNSEQIEIHHVESFHINGRYHTSRTNWNLKSSSTGMIQTVLSIVFLIPGFIIGSAFKGLAYLYNDVREKHALAVKHFTPINREIGTYSEPVKTIEELKKALNIEWKSDPLNRPTNALIIHGDGSLQINEEPGILQFNPMKLILEGTEIIHRSSPVERLGEAMRRSRKWQVSDFREASSSKPHKSAVNAKGVANIEEALKASAPIRSWIPFKRYHMVYSVAAQ